MLLSTLHAFGRAGGDEAECSRSRGVIRDGDESQALRFFLALLLASSNKRAATPSHRKVVALDKRPFYVSARTRAGGSQ